MLKSLAPILSLLISNLFSDSQILVTATILPHANTQIQVTSIDNKNIQQDIYLKTNLQGLTIALSDNYYGSSIFVNESFLSTTPINFSNRVHTKYTKVGKLIISQKENKGFLGVTIAVK